jgi:hypothetical protein
MLSKWKKYCYSVINSLINKLLTFITFSYKAALSGKKTPSKLWSHQNPRCSISCVTYFEVWNGSFSFRDRFFTVPFTPQLFRPRFLVVVRIQRFLKKQKKVQVVQVLKRFFCRTFNVQKQLLSVRDYQYICFSRNRWFCNILLLTLKAKNGRTFGSFVSVFCFS